MSEPPFEVLTVGELVRIGGRVGISCAACGRFRYLRTAGMSENQNVRMIGDKVRCNGCGSPRVESWAVFRDPETGFWPAEQS